VGAVRARVYGMFAPTLARGAHGQGHDVGRSRTWIHNHMFIASQPWTERRRTRVDLFDELVFKQ